MIRALVLLTVTVAFACWPLHAQDAPKLKHRDKPAEAVELAAITERGRAIAAYDEVAWHATDAVQALHPPKGVVTMYLGRQTPQGWSVAFGTLSPSRDSFLLAYQTEPDGDVKHPRLVVNTPPVEDRSEWLYEARAYDLARSKMSTVKVQPYNGTVLAGPDGGWYVYFYPAQTDLNVFPTGADTRFLVSHDGSHIVETHQLHMSLLNQVLESEGKDGKPAKTEMTFHTAVLDDAPEDTDVSNVLMMHGIPMLVVTKSFVYRIQPDGAIVYLSPTSVFLKDKKK